MTPDDEKFLANVEYNVKNLECSGVDYNSHVTRLIAMVRERDKDLQLIVTSEALLAKKFEESHKRVKTLESALTVTLIDLGRAHHELGVNQPGYPAPVANANDIICAAREKIKEVLG